MNRSDPCHRRWRLERWLLLAAASLALLACQGPAPRDLAQPAPTPTAPAPIAFDDAILKAANELLSKTQLPPAGSRRQALLIDPLVDGVTGSQSLATRSMEQRIVELVRRDYPQLEVQAFTGSNLAGQPLVLVGTLTPINNLAGQPSGERDAFRICLALADLKDGKVIGKGVARARPDGVPTTPLPFDADSPAWTRDAATDGYIRTCQGSKAGDPINPVYAARIMAAALLNDASNAYNRRRYHESLELYRRALDTAGGDQLRAHNGAYLSAWKLKRRDEATQAFARLVDYGLANRQLALKFLFRPGSTQFIADAQISGPYPLWLDQIARRSFQSRACLEIVGHTSRSGPEPINQRLSVLRAQAIKDRLDGAEPRLIKRTLASGVGSRENLVGSGSDDASDALDRRVEFRVLDC
ncbi:MAG: Outer membrane protein-associated (lipo)protein [Candidatus Accumulibacter adjunctus]|uniref:Outer membrane protein-associated (Lipo)protein n=1 Tax=Candidatus Accumulibacter adjunctus TaxID=1454001 RepID=A0A011NS63_9PROT|nr:MAG: Outer membrane protein-associated (lipo)protein [Candidatus Accumulibacter adjunctus]